MTTQVKEPTTAAAPAAAVPVVIAPETATPVVAADPAAALTREKRKFTVAEYYRMAEVGILHHTERVELLDGEIIVMAPIGEPHATVVDRLTLAFAEVSRGRSLSGCRTLSVWTMGPSRSRTLPSCGCGRIFTLTPIPARRMCWW